MFKYYSIKKYGSKLLPILVKRYGEKKHYSASEVRATVFQCNFNPKLLPLGYMLFLTQSDLKNVLYIEYPHLDVKQYKKEISDYLSIKRYCGYLQKLT